MSEEKKGFFGRIAQGLSKTRKNISDSIGSVLKNVNFSKLDEDVYDELTEALILADIGARTADEIIEALRKGVKENKVKTAEDARELLASEISAILRTEDAFELPSPSIVLIVGVNGVGKTTSIGKLSARFIADGKKVIVAAGDTFRAAAIDQLEVWAERAGAQIVRQQENSDPGAVIFDAIRAAVARNTDILICDTAGRLQNKQNLMEELRKISKIIDREYPQARREVLLVLDGTTGQNALSQAAVFKEITKVTGVILTKLDGTAKGGIIVPIKRDLGLPVRFVCVGEGLGDILPFDAEEFAKGLFMG
ncbi:MAG: signal recognition particle-docking protein FtsY [Defluviitaleaceae bacterium]|nr:signal recognition particle-docking protein FtsY [Defluviitaleaceae bacterium]MCL2836835.1 signal recognition particle-docking protein FtsY [Defluviitaleaceae bacterium]